MKTSVEFRSNKFPPETNEEEQINPGLWGRKLAAYLRQKLVARGIETNDIYAEDWGWVVPIKNDSFQAWIGCGHQHGDEDQFLCFIEPVKPFVRKLFKKINTMELVARLTQVLNEILTSDPEIREVRWLDEAES